MGETLTVYIEGLGDVPAIKDSVLGLVPLILETDNETEKIAKEQYTAELIRKYGIKPIAGANQNDNK